MRGNFKGRNFRGRALQRNMRLAFLAHAVLLALLGPSAHAFGTGMINIKDWGMPSACSSKLSLNKDVCTQADGLVDDIRCTI